MAIRDAISYRPICKPRALGWAPYRTRRSASGRTDHGRRVTETLTVADHTAERAAGGRNTYSWRSACMSWSTTKDLSVVVAVTAVDDVARVTE